MPFALSGEGGRGKGTERAGVNNAVFLAGAVGFAREGEWGESCCPL